MGRGEGPCGGQGTQQGGRQKDWAEKPVRVPGPSEIGRSGEAHCWDETIVALGYSVLEEEFNAMLRSRKIPLLLTFSHVDIPTRRGKLPTATH